MDFHIIRFLEKGTLWYKVKEQYNHKVGTQGMGKVVIRHI